MPSCGGSVRFLDAVLLAIYGGRIDAICCSLLGDTMSGGRDTRLARCRGLTIKAWVFSPVFAVPVHVCVAIRV